MTETLLYGRSRMPLYAQAAGQLRLKILRGEWPRGLQIPIIEELQEEFGLSRATIREALDMLEQDGLIERHRGRGTFVRESLPERRTFALPSRWEDLVRDLETLDAQMVAPIGEASGEALRDVLTGRAEGGYACFQRIHCHDNEPYCLIDIYLRKDVYERDSERFQTSPVVLVLAQRHPELATVFRQRVTFSIADERTALALGIALGAPVVEILRTIADSQGHVVTHTYARYPGDYVHLDFEFPIGAAAAATEER